MYLYHFTSASNVESIRSQGILPGEYPFRELGGPPLVSLTCLLDSTRHGLFTGEVVKEPHPAFAKLSEKFPSAVKGAFPNRTICLPDMTEVAIEIRIERLDPKLLSLDQFAKRIATNTERNDVGLLKAAALATADFPLADAEDGELDDHVQKYRALEVEGLLDYRGWHFYSGVVSPRRIHKVLSRRADRSYADA